MSRSTRVRDERGDSLVEILVALAVLGIGITGLLTALVTHASTTTINKDQAQIETALLSAAEYVKALPYVACTGTPTGWTTIDSTSGAPAVPADGSYLLEYGQLRQLGTADCAELAQVTVRVTGNGFQDVQLDVVKRP